MKQNKAKQLSKFTIGYIGLGKMGLNMACNMAENGHTVIANNRSPDPIKKAVKHGAQAAYNTKELFEKIKENLKRKKQTKKIIWIMLPAGDITENKIKEITPFLKRGDILIDGSNSIYKDAIRRSKNLYKKGINFVDVGVSGGPRGARHGACMMVGGSKNIFNYLKPLFTSLCVSYGVEHFNGPGAGHYVKMVHNGIEYGIMESLAEGFEILKKSRFDLNLMKVSRVYNHGSIIESKLMTTLHKAFHKHGNSLVDVPGRAGQGGSAAGGKVKAEADWTLDEAKVLKVHYHAIGGAVIERAESREKPSYRGKIINAVRNQFGGHSLKTAKDSVKKKKLKNKKSKKQK
jgi:6-phosphogluconate dehydrogenase